MGQKKCETCHLRDQEGRKKLTISYFEKKITADNSKKNIEFVIIQVLNIIEMKSCFTCTCEIQGEKEPTENELGLAFAIHGAKKLREDKLPLIIKEIESPLNMFGAGEEFGHEPNLWEAFKHYILLGHGLEKFYEEHLEFIN